MQIEGIKLIFIMSISVLDFFKFASRMPQIAQILVSTFKIFRESIPPDPLEISSFFPWAIPGSDLFCLQSVFRLLYRHVYLLSPCSFNSWDVCDCMCSYLLGCTLQATDPAVWAVWPWVYFPSHLSFGSQSVSWQSLWSQECVLWTGKCSLEFACQHSQ